MAYKILNIEGTLLSQEQLEKHLEKVAVSHVLNSKSKKYTYPIPRMKDNYEVIKEVYELLNQHIKMNILIHPAGEWLLDNFYIIEETVKAIEKELTLKKYINFTGIQNGIYEGYARIYVLASEIVAYTDNRCDKDNLQRCLEAYQTQKTLSMDEIWNIGVFLQIAIIEKIRRICEIIYISQMQKLKVESIVNRLVEKNNKKFRIYRINFANKTKTNIEYPFIEYMSYRLKKYGKKAYGYIEILEEIMLKKGTTVSDIIKKEHFDIAINKVSIGNSISSIKEIQRINFLEIFEKINGVEEILRKDPAEVYEKMDYKTKEYYRNKIKEISVKTKISEIYIAKKILEFAQNNQEERKKHVGYFLIDRGIDDLYKNLQGKKEIHFTAKLKTILYISCIFIFSILISVIFGILISKYIDNKIVVYLSSLLIVIPITELITQILQYILGKIIKPQIIPKIDFYKGIDEENATIVVIPTIISSKQKVTELMRKLEVFYLANKSNNLYFALLGDCTQSKKEYETFDQELVKEGVELAEKLNKKYSQNEFPIFHFLYRRRTWNKSEETYLGWERKRGLINEFNEYILGNDKDNFKSNTIEEWKNKAKKNIPNIKYIITLDSDTNLVLNSAFELVGAMAHILNKPIIDGEKNIVVGGYALIQPRIGVDLQISYKNLFTKIFAGAGGIDSYTNAISDTYQDNFGEGIYTGKGIYDLAIFSKVLKDEIPENTVLSHDLLEGCYLRCGLATDILLMDGYPTKYISFSTRLSRWIRGDWQICKWLKNKKLNLLSKYKIFDNLRRSLLEVTVIIDLIFIACIEQIYSINLDLFQTIVLIIASIPFLLDIINIVIFKKDGEKKLKIFATPIDGIKGALIRMSITVGCIPYKAYISDVAKWKTIYRMCISHKHLLEWTTAEEAEQNSKEDVFSYYKSMFVNVIFGVIALIIGIKDLQIFEILIGMLWLFAPIVMCYISKTNKIKNWKNKISKEEKEYLYDIGKKTWNYFEDYLNRENNFLIPDNYQEDRKQVVVNRTSSTNIGLSLLAVISAFDLNYITKKDAVEKIFNMTNTINELPKWNGHLYNWYNIKTKEYLYPRYVSTVDSGNFIGYLFVVKSFLEDLIKEYKNEEINLLEKSNQTLELVEKIINNTNFSVLYSYEKRLFSIGFNIEENKMTDSYYDLLASEARQASYVAIAKRDVPAKHWVNLSRTLTDLNNYKGLISWSGTAFEYLMPNINIPRYEGSLLDESCKFAIMSQIEYSKRLGIPWGISEAAFNVKDLYSNYQYKAFGIPWLGLKRGLADEMVVASYGSILALTDKPKEVTKNLKELEKQGMYKKYGFYESIDYSPGRVEKGKIGSPVKTYMAHHQGLILLSINNFFNNNIMQKRFMKNPEIEAVSVLLQERMPEVSILTKENKEKVEKLKYVDYENYTTQVFNKIDERLIQTNVISNVDYTVAINQKGEGFSKYKDIYINRFKKTDDYNQGIFFYIKNIKTNKIWSTNYNRYTSMPDRYSVSFMPDKDKFERIDGNIKTKMVVTVTPNEAVEIRRIELENVGNNEEILEVSSFFEPILSNKEQEYAHQAFNNLFLTFEYDEQNQVLILKRKKRAKNENEIFLATKMCTDAELIGDNEYEIDKEKFLGRTNLQVPQMIKMSIPFSKKIGLVTEPIVAQKRIIKIKPNEKVYMDLLISINNEKNTAVETLNKYDSYENVQRIFELSKATVEAESRYLGVKGKDIVVFQKILGFLIFQNPLKSMNLKVIPKHNYKQSDLWKYGISGDLPIILLRIKDANDIYAVREMIKAYEFFKSKNVNVELVIIDEEKYSYENYVEEGVENEILNNHLSYMKNTKGGIFLLSKNQIEKNDMQLLMLVSSIVIDAHLGKLENIIEDLENEYLDNYSEVANERKIAIDKEMIYDSGEIPNPSLLKYYNEYGGFSEDGKEYILKIDKNNKLPTVWSHILSNKKFGTVITENMGGYTWYKNSRLNRVTSWHNSAVMDIPSEMVYLKDMDTQKSWTISSGTKPDDNSYNVVYGFGYAKYMHNSYGIIQEMEVFVPQEDSIKVSIVKLKNDTPNKRKLKLYYYTKVVMEEDEIKSNEYIDSKYEENSNIVFARNLYRNEFQDDIVFVSSSEKIKSYTGDKKGFLGNGGLENPDGLQKVSLDNRSGLGCSGNIVIEIEVELDSFSDKEIIFSLGAEENLMGCKDLAYKYSKVTNCYYELTKIKNYWNELLERVKVETPAESMNIMLNGWTMYQTIASRLNAKSGFYQSGGAFGYRDQLQDTLGMKYLKPEMMKEQIIKHSEHQFYDGDVLHWWHEDTKRGIRTRFSDDLLWLVFLVIEYINFTGDNEILDIETGYLQGKSLEDGQDEIYDVFLLGDIKENIYEHCKKAIKKSLNFGENGLPKIGSGDWNDGFSEVGNKGKGESVWLGFFLYYILDKFSVICSSRNDYEFISKIDEIKMALRKALNTNGWDGRWYKRAFTDDGQILGSMENEECRIDGISQSWAVISGAGDNDKKYISMESLEKHLIDRENRLIKLLDPPFEKGKLEPGYIKAYLPGVRENGGQYTHECCC